MKQFSQEEIWNKNSKNEAPHGAGRCGKNGSLILISNWKFFPSSVKFHDAFSHNDVERFPSTNWDQFMFCKTPTNQARLKHRTPPRLIIASCEMLLRNRSVAVTGCIRILLTCLRVFYEFVHHLLVLLRVTEWIRVGSLFIFPSHSNFFLLFSSKNDLIEFENPLDVLSVTIEPILSLYYGAMVPYS